MTNDIIFFQMADGWKKDLIQFKVVLVISAEIKYIIVQFTIIMYLLKTGVNKQMKVLLRNSDNMSVGIDKNKIISLITAVLKGLSLTAK